MEKTKVKHQQMKRLNCGQPLKYNEEKLVIDPNTIPILIPAAAQKEWITEENPVFAIQEIEYPIRANGYLYEESFFQSFLEANKKRPFAGSALGHSYGARGKTDLVMVGGLLVSNGGGTGKVYFKNYLLPGDGSLRKEFRSNMIHFSLVSMTRDEYKKNDDTGEWVWHVVKSEGAERNDVVDTGAGAMKQKVNHKRNKTDSQSIMQNSVRFARSLINSGKYDNSSSWSFTAADSDKILGDNDWTNYKKWFFVEDTAYDEETKGRYKYAFGKNGKLYRSGLRAVASRAGQQKWEELSNLASELIGLIDKKESGVPGDDISYNEGDNMPITKQEMIDHLKTNILTLPEIVQVLGMSDQIVTDVHKNAVKTIDELKALGSTDPVKELKELRENVKANFATMRNARLDREFGLPELVVGDEKKTNVLRIHAGDKLGNVSEKDFDAALKNFKENDVVAKSITEQTADGESKINIMAPDEKTKQNNQPLGEVNGIKIKKME
jgi:hypothetical protein